MNGNGIPITLSQTFATTPGEHYVLSFGQRSTLTQSQGLPELVVNVADLSRSFPISNDVSYVVKTCQFTAVSNYTMVRFTDTSRIVPDVHSTFLDAISVVANRELESVVDGPEEERDGPK
nr:hypothetical protein [uncultured bacterium]